MKKISLNIVGTNCSVSWKDCPHASVCANHATAGDFRFETGNTPKLIILKEKYQDKNIAGPAECYGIYPNKFGALVWQGLSKYGIYNCFDNTGPEPLPNHVKDCTESTNKLTKEKKNVGFKLAKILVERSDSGEFMSPDFYFEGKQDPFVSFEFEKGSKTRKILEEIESLIETFNTLND